jgi:2-methylcitrate dehydratase
MAARRRSKIASFINSAMIRNLDFNDRYPGGHPSDCLGALLALAGATPIDGRRFLAAMTVAYEIFARLADAAKLSRRGWDQGFGIALSTTAALCNLLQLSCEATAHAVGIAATSSLPLRVTRSGELTPWKNAATAYAVRNGVFAALLAREGMVGPGNAFEGRNGLWENVTGPFELLAFPNKGGEPLTPKVQIKYWPVETNGQPVIFAALKLRDLVDPHETSKRSRSSPPSSPGSRSAASRRNGTRARARPPTTACPTCWRARWSTGRFQLPRSARTPCSIRRCVR